MDQAVGGLQSESRSNQCCVLEVRPAGCVGLIHLPLLGGFVDIADLHDALQRMRVPCALKERACLQCC